MAVKSSPDLVGIVSWNEFSENSHIEPSVRRGNESLRALASILSATVPATIAADSSEPGAAADFPFRPVVLLLVAFGVIAGSLATLARRGRQQRRSEPRTPRSGDDRLDLDAWDPGRRLHRGAAVRRRGWPS